jgi:hypothetical protein
MTFLYNYFYLAVSSYLSIGWITDYRFIKRMKAHHKNPECSANLLEDVADQIVGGMAGGLNAKSNSPSSRLNQRNFSITAFLAQSKKCLA